MKTTKLTTDDLAVAGLPDEAAVHGGRFRPLEVVVEVFNEAAGHFVRVHRFGDLDAGSLT